MSLISSDHRREDRTSDAHQADKIGFDDRRPVIGWSLIKARASSNVVTGIVDENVNRLEGVGDDIEQPIDRGAGGNIKFDGVGLWTEFLGPRRKGISVPVDEDDLAAAINKRARDRAAHSTRCSRDHNVLVEYPLHEPVPFRGNLFSQ